MRNQQRTAQGGCDTASDSQNVEPTSGERNGRAEQPSQNQHWRTDGGLERRGRRRRVLQHQHWTHCPERGRAGGNHVLEGMRRESGPQPTAQSVNRRDSCCNLNSPLRSEARTAMQRHIWPRKDTIVVSCLFEPDNSHKRDRSDAKRLPASSRYSSRPMKCAR